MHDHGIWLAVLGVYLLIEPKQPTIAIRFFLRRKALFLSASDIQDVGTLQTRLQRIKFLDLMARAAQRRFRGASLVA